MIEIWRGIKDYEGLYQVSNLGRVRSLDHWVNAKGNSKRLVKGIILKLKYSKSGYLRVGLRNPNQIFFLVHRLVAMTFPDLVDWTEDAKGKPFDELQVNHKDQNKLNNCVNNLEWCTASYNVNYGDRNKKVSEWHKQNNKVRKAVLQFTLDGKFVAEYPSVKEAERQTGIFDTSIIRCCKGKGHTAGGYVWRYA